MTWQKGAAGFNSIHQKPTVKRTKVTVIALTRITASLNTSAVVPRVAQAGNLHLARGTLDLLSFEQLDIYCPYYNSCQSQKLLVMRCGGMLYEKNSPSQFLLLWIAAVRP